MIVHPLFFFLLDDLFWCLFFSAPKFLTKTQTKFRQTLRPNSDKDSDKDTDKDSDKKSDKKSDKESDKNQRLKFRQKSDIMPGLGILDAQCLLRRLSTF